MKALGRDKENRNMNTVDQTYRIHLTELGKLEIIDHYDHGCFYITHTFEDALEYARAEKFIRKILRVVFNKGSSKRSSIMLSCSLGGYIITSSDVIKHFGTMFTNPSYAIVSSFPIPY
jgi:hypothetical protein